MKRKTPSTLFLVLLNGLLFFRVGAIGANIIGIWLYNSDDGSVHVWTQGSESWIPHKWGWEGDRMNERLRIDPPLDLFPDYARDRYEPSQLSSGGSG